MPTLRERGKEKRRQEVLAAASSLWRERGVEAVGLPEIAATAEVSLQTVYNLIGGIDALKVAVAEQHLARLERAVEGALETGLARSRLRAITSAHLLIDDAELHRGLFVGIPQALFDGARLSRHGSELQHAALTEARRLGEIAPRTDLAAVALQIHLQFVGGLMAWACGTLDDAGFLRAAELAALGPVVAVATDHVRPRIQDRMRVLLSQRRGGAR